MRATTPSPTTSGTSEAELYLRLGDSALVLAQRLTEWVAHAPTMEEDVALANVALDLLGQARALLSLAGDEDELAYLRDERAFRNLLLVELPNGDFAQTQLRQFFYDAYAVELWQALTLSRDEALAAIAGKAVKETRYHLRHSSGWVVRLGDGTDESAERLSLALDGLWPFTGEPFVDDDVARGLAEAGVAPLPSSLERAWLARVSEVFAGACLAVPATARHQVGGRQGRHTEHLGSLLAEMQALHRAHPGARW